METINKMFYVSILYENESMFQSTAIRANDAEEAFSLAKDLSSDIWIYIQVYTLKR